jgi:hypothetical protein
LKFKRHKEEIIYVELYDELEYEEDYLVGKGVIKMSDVTDAEEEMEVVLLKEKEDVGTVFLDVKLGSVPIPGVLTVTPLMAKIDRENKKSKKDDSSKEKGGFKKQDPYCIIKVGKQKEQTPADEFGGKTPKWEINDPFIFRVEEEEYIDIEIWDKIEDKDDELVCTGEIRVNEVPTEEEETVQVKLTIDDNAAGKVYLKMIFKGEKMSK